MRQTRQTVVLPDEQIGQLEPLSQPVVVYGRQYIEGEISPFHHHERAQLVYASSGVVKVTTHLAAYVVPPQRAVWMPAGVEHRIDALRMFTMQTLYVIPTETERCPDEPCVLQVTPLLRELIIAAVAAGNDYQSNSPQARIMQVILDQISAQPVVSLSLPFPDDQRLRRVTETLMENPSDSRNLEQWAQYVGASKRTLNRLFASQTGMSFRDWRQ